MPVYRIFEGRLDSSALEDLLGFAGVQPAECRSYDGAPALALALHCLLVRKGFHCQHGDGLAPFSYTPQPDWNKVQEPAWVFEYRRKRCPNRFRLEVSLKVTAGRVVVCAEELHFPPSGQNIQYLGLTLEKYIPDATKLNQPRWKGVFEEEAALKALFDEYIGNPLVEHAEEEPLEEAGSTARSWLADLSAWTHARVSSNRRSPLVTCVVCVAVVAGVGALVWAHRGGAKRTSSVSK